MNVRLTPRGELVLAVLISITLIGALWLASAIGYLLTGCAG